MSSRRQPTRGGLPAWEFGEVLTTFHREKKLVTKCSYSYFFYENKNSVNRSEEFDRVHNPLVCNVFTADFKRPKITLMHILQNILAPNGK